MELRCSSCEVGMAGRSQIRVTLRHSRHDTKLGALAEHLWVALERESIEIGRTPGRAIFRSQANQTRSICFDWLRCSYSQQKNVCLAFLPVRWHSAMHCINGKSTAQPVGRVDHLPLYLSSLRVSCRIATLLTRSHRLENDRSLELLTSSGLRQQPKEEMRCLMLS